MNAGGEMHDGIHLQTRRPTVRDTIEIISLVHPLRHAFGANTPAAHEPRNLVPGREQRAAERAPDEPVRARNDDPAHSHFQPKRLKKWYADIANRRT
ncbi:hypothetical protein BpKM390_28210 [Burkholderia pseudomallei]|nr:hypothetical protein GTC019_27020 [Burkholderia pseudomallei]BEH37573.1 hypothetical protein GTC254T_26680 [Burkholderia pseudomallei]BEH49462.1 hypothetical protein TKS_26940 [Burkholderia pseudomallei]BEH55491.1 hypothetical protein BpKM376_26700 [Burkholderia pseudomallei]BEH61576.1 hypothetical protein BpKM390_28210 [Burkholderia pseudomallei]